MASLLNNTKDLDDDDPLAGLGKDEQEEIEDSDSDDLDGEN